MISSLVQAGDHRVVVIDTRYLHLNVRIIYRATETNCRVVVESRVANSH